MSKAEISVDQRAIEHLVLDARHPCIALITQEEAHALELLRASVVGQEEPLWLWTVTRGLVDGLYNSGGAIPNTEHPAAALVHLATQMRHPAICAMLDLAPHLRDDRTLRAMRDVVERFRESESRLVLIDHEPDYPASIVGDIVTHDIALPGVDELERLVRNTIKRVDRRVRVEARLTRAELAAIVQNLRGLTRRQAEQIIVEVTANDRRICAADIPEVLARKRKRLHYDGILEFIEAPVDLDEIGGLERLKDWLRRRCVSDAAKAEAFGLVQARGVLLLGVQGSGKSLSAKAAATALKRPLLRLDPGALYDRFIGESERRLRQTLQQAESMAPIVLWIDEIEKGFASAAAQSTDGGLSQRMFGTLLTWMQDHQSPVFLVATANNIDALPPELLRKGRFDEIFFVDLPSREVRERILHIHLARRKREPSRFDLGLLAEVAEGYSGSEIEQAIVASLHDAFADGAEIDTARIERALRNSPPLSVTMAERVQSLRHWARARCVPAD